MKIKVRNILRQIEAQGEGGDLEPLGSLNEFIPHRFSADLLMFLTNWQSLSNYNTHENL